MIAHSAQTYACRNLKQLRADIRETSSERYTHNHMHNQPRKHLEAASFNGIQLKACSHIAFTKARHPCSGSSKQTIQDGSSKSFWCATSAVCDPVGQAVCQAVQNSSASRIEWNFPANSTASFPDGKSTTLHLSTTCNPYIHWLHASYASSIHS